MSDLRAKLGDIVYAQANLVHVRKRGGDMVQAQERCFAAQEKLPFGSPAILAQMVLDCLNAELDAGLELGKPRCVGCKGALSTPDRCYDCMYGAESEEP